MTLRELFESGDSFTLYGVQFDAHSEGVLPGQTGSFYWGQFGADGDDNGGALVQIDENGGVAAYFQGEEVYSKHIADDDADEKEAFSEKTLARALRRVADHSGLPLPNPEQDAIAGT